jgi:hypothetical protein
LVSFGIFWKYLTFPALHNLGIVLIPLSAYLHPFPKTWLFRYEVLKKLKAEGKITDVIVENMMNWSHSGFNVYCGKVIWPHNEEGVENLARFIIRASFSQERNDIYCGW